MRARALSTIGVILLSLCGPAAAWSITRTTVVSCAASGGTNNSDLVNRGIYITNYAGNNLAQVELTYAASKASNYRVTLTARRGTFDGPVVGSTQVATANVGTIAAGIATVLVFDFGAAPVTPGDTITFTQTSEDLNGTGGLLFFNRGGSCPGVVETIDTAPPLSTPTGNTAAIVVTEVNLSTSCIASDTVMCLDNNTGDQRFKATATFHTSQGGGSSGNGQEIPLSSLGVNHGGLLWFFNASNPEMLIKVINGCPVNSRFWVFISAGTNVGFDVTIVDTNNNHTVVYHNPDLTAAVPVQDVNALACP